MASSARGAAGVGGAEEGDSDAIAGAPLGGGVDGEEVKLTLYPYEERGACLWEAHGGMGYGMDSRGMALPPAPAVAIELG